MFSIDLNMTDLKVRERNLYKVFFSMNIHQVAATELGAEDAKSYIFFFREGGKYLSYIGLYFVRADRTLYYSYSSNPFSESELPSVEDEARSFAEDMGAMLDELGLAKMSDVEKDRWIDEQDIFSSRKKAAAKADEPSTAGGVAQPGPSDSSAPVVQPAPSVQSAPSPAEKSAPVQLPPAQQPAPPIQPETASVPQSPPKPAPSPEAQSQVKAPQASRPQRKQAAARPSALVDLPMSAVRKQALSPADVLEQAVKAGVVKAPKPSVKKDVQNGAGIASRDKEALARLLASF